MNKSEAERRKSQFAQMSNNLAKIILDPKERKLQSRQQKILNIVKNTPSDGIKKLNLFAHKQSSTAENAIAFINQYKIKVKMFKCCFLANCVVFELFIFRLAQSPNPPPKKHQHLQDQQSPINPINLFKKTSRKKP